ncbi:11778_t:CDS:2, partial [Ambispora leptoticha]
MASKNISEAKSYQQQIEQKIQAAKAKHQAPATTNENENKLSWPVKIAFGAGIIGRIHQVKKISKPSQHIHLRVEEIKKNCRGRGIYLISTSLGLLTHREALAQKQGGK